MLVAEKQQYLEAYDTYRNEDIQVVEKPKIVSNPKVKTKRKNKILPIMIVLAGFGLCSLTVARYAMIAQNQADILKLEQVLEEEYKKESRLKLELSYCEDLDKIEEFAKNNLEMNYPDKSQILYVELPQQNADQVDDEKESDEQIDEQINLAQQDGVRLWDRIVSLLD